MKSKEDQKIRKMNLLVNSKIKLTTSVTVTNCTWANYSSLWVRNSELPLFNVHTNYNFREWQINCLIIQKQAACWNHSIRLPFFLWWSHIYYVIAAHVWVKRYSKKLIQRRLLREDSRSSSISPNLVQVNRITVMIHSLIISAV